MKVIVNGGDEDDCYGDNSYEEENGLNCNDYYNHGGEEVEMCVCVCGGSGLKRRGWGYKSKNTTTAESETKFNSERK